MLIYFKVANYRSIKDPVVFNFTATSISEHVDSNIITDVREPLLRTLLLCGHNASGKSNLIGALAFFRHFIINSAIEHQRGEQIATDAFALSEQTDNQPSFFEARFIIGKLTYRYGFEADREAVHKEWLFESTATKEYPVFLRMGDKYEIQKKRFPNAQGVEKKTRKNALFLSVASQWNEQKAEAINEWFAGSFAIHGLMDAMYSINTIELLQDKKYMKSIKAFIKKADLGIVDLGVIDIPVKGIDKASNISSTVKEFVKSQFTEDFKTVFTKHPKYNVKNEQVDLVTFFMDMQESAGTRKYFNLIGILVYAIANNRLVIIDELDAGLHPLLTKSIIKLFNDKAVKGSAQLLVASHDTTLLDKELLRRDQIYFAEKNHYGATKITSLVEFKVRKESPYDKNYLEGKYGAIPIIEELSSALYD